MLDAEFGGSRELQFILWHYISLQAVDMQRKGRREGRRRNGDCCHFLHLIDWLTAWLTDYLLWWPAAQLTTPAAAAVIAAPWTSSRPHLEHPHHCLANWRLKLIMTDWLTDGVCNWATAMANKVTWGRSNVISFTSLRYYYSFVSLH